MLVLFILKSAWQDQSTFYCSPLTLHLIVDMWGFTGLSFVLICISVIEITVVTVYLALCNENYHWYPWSSSALTSLGGGVHSWSAHRQASMSFSIQPGTWSSDWTLRVSFQGLFFSSIPCWLALCMAWSAERWGSGALITSFGVFMGVFPCPLY